MFYAVTGDAPVLLPGAEAIRLPGSFRMRHGDRIADFLEQLLQRDGSKRLRCHEALISAYLSTSLVVDREADGQIIALSHKKEALFECIQSMRTARGRLHLGVSRATLVDDVVQGILGAPRANLLCKFSVRFEGEAGIDAGGLTAEMYSSFFSALLSPESLLFESSGSEDGSSSPGDNKALCVHAWLAACWTAFGTRAWRCSLDCSSFSLASCVRDGNIVLLSLLFFRFCCRVQVLAKTVGGRFAAKYARSAVVDARGRRSFVSESNF